VARSAALREHGDAVDRGGRQRNAVEEHRPRHDFDVTDDSTGEPGDEPIGRVVVGVIDGRVKLRLGGGGGQSREELENLALVAGPGRGHPALLEHPRGWLEGQNRVFREVVDRGTLGGGPPADHRAGRANVDRGDCL
jgi:hypothetical protein